MRLKQTSRNLAAFVTLAVLLIAPGGAYPAGQEWLASEGKESKQPKAPPAWPDPCGCAGQLTACLFVATLTLNRCLSNARGPVQEAICFVRYEVRVGLCFQESAGCFARCIA